MPPTSTPCRIETARLVLRRPSRDDAEEIFARYASDLDVTRYVGWPVHRSIDDTRAFLQFSESEWTRWDSGPYLVLSRADGRLLGSTGFAFEDVETASTGYVLAREAWGHGFATEAVRAVVDLAAGLTLPCLYALCHAKHLASARVLEKCGFALERLMVHHMVFPNLGRAGPSDVLRYSRSFGSGRAGKWKAVPAGG